MCAECTGTPRRGNLTCFRDCRHRPALGRSDTFIASGLLGGSLVMLSRLRCLSLLFGVITPLHCANLHAGATVRHASSAPRSADADQNGANTASVHPILNAEQVLTRLLALIRDSRSVHEFTPEYLSEKMGVPFATHRPGQHVFGEPVTVDWSYVMEMDENLKPNPRLDFDFRSDPGTSPPMSDICLIDFERFKTELEAMGFSSEPRYGLHGALFNFTFFRSNLHIEVYPEGEANEPIEKISHRCVKMVLIT